MTQVFTSQEMVNIANDYNRRMSAFLRLLRNLRSSEKMFLKNESAAADISSEMNRLLGEVQGIKDGIVTDLTFINFDTYAVTVPVGHTPRYVSLDINATAGTLTANVEAGLTDVFGDGAGGNLFFEAADAAVTVSDVISLSNCEDAANDGEYILHASTAPTNTVITLATAMTSGVDNTADSSAVITLKERTLV